MCVSSVITLQNTNSLSLNLQTQIYVYMLKHHPVCVCGKYSTRGSVVGHPQVLHIFFIHMNLGGALTVSYVYSILVLPGLDIAKQQTVERKLCSNHQSSQLN